MILKERDIKRMKLIGDLGFISTEQLNEIYPYNGIYSLNSMRRRMQQLNKEGFVNIYRKSAFSQNVYYLTKKGCQLIRNHYGVSPKQFQKTYLQEHNLLITEVYIQLKKTHKLLDFDTNFELKLFDIRLVPDAFIKYRHKPNALKLIFLEVDRATESIGVIIRKLEKYDKVKQSKKVEQHFGVFPLIVFMTTSNIRAENIRKTIPKFLENHVIVSTFDYEITKLIS